MLAGIVSQDIVHYTLHYTTYTTMPGVIYGDRSLPTYLASHIMYVSKSVTPTHRLGANTESSPLFQPQALQAMVGATGSETSESSVRK